MRDQQHRRSRDPVQRQDDLELDPAVERADRDRAEVRSSAVMSRDYGEERQGGPFAPAINAALGGAFGASLDGITVERNADRDNAAIGAAASTRGSAIALSSSVGEDLHDGRSMEIIAHEVAHALAPSNGTGLDRPGDRGEDRADVAGTDFRRHVEGGLAGPAPRLERATGGAAAVHRYELEGPFSKNDPVHEVLTLSTLKEALKRAPKRGELLGGVKEDKLPSMDSKSDHNLEPTKIDRSAQQFVRGVIWPDDPKGYLFDDGKTTENYSSGLMWYDEFDASEKDQKDKLIARSHYGDLQFFHAMASKDGQSPQETKAKIMQWSTFLSEVATGRLDTNLKVADVPLAAELFPSNHKLTIKQLFGEKDLTDLEARQRAAGALMHLIQDSHAEGHTERNSKTGAIEQFRSYEQQDHHKHGEKDHWAEGAKLSDRVKATPGAAAAIEHGTVILLMLDAGASMEDIIKYLDQEIFKLSPTAHASGPGEEFEKDKDKHKDKHGH